MTAERRRALTGRLVEAFGEAALQLPDTEVRELKYHEITFLSAYDIRTATICQASLAAPTPEFETSPPLLTRHLALSAGRRVHKFDGSLTAAMRNAMAEAMASERWPGPYLNEESRDVRALCASKAITWLNRTLDVLDVDDLRRWQFNRDLTWNFPGRGLKLKAKLDLLTPPSANSPTPVPVLVVPNTAEESLNRVAFTLLLLLINDLRPIDEARIVVHASGEVLTVEPDALVDRAIDAATRALDAVVVRDSIDRDYGGDGGHSLRPPSHLDLAPGQFVCRDCAFVQCSRRYGASPEVDHGSAMIVRGGVRLGQGTAR